MSRLIANYMSMWTPLLSISSPSLHLSFSFFDLHLTVYDLVQVTKDYRLARVSGPLTYNDITTASSEGRRDIWTDRERGWDEAEAIDTGQNRPPIYNLLKYDKRNQTHLCRRQAPLCFCSFLLGVKVFLIF